MRRRTLALIVAAGVLAVALVVGVVTAGAQGPSSLPSITVSQLLQNVAAKAQGTTAISGDFAWSNDLLGGASSLLSLSGNQTPAGLSSLLTGGSGRVWAQDGKVRLESQGQNGDFVAVGQRRHHLDLGFDDHDRHPVRAAAATGGAAQALPSPETSLDPAVAIDRLIQKLAPTATLAVSGQTTVAGRETYTLTITPTSPVTSFGSVAVAIDGIAGSRCGCRSSPRATARRCCRRALRPCPSDRSRTACSPSPRPSGATVVHQNVSAGQNLAGMTGKAGRERQEWRATQAATLAQASHGRRSC